MKLQKTLLILASGILAACMALTPMTARAETTRTTGGVKSTNAHYHTYHYYGMESNYGTVVNSNLYYEDGAWKRVEFISGNVIVETYDEKFTFKASKTVPGEMALYGGCYIGAKYNFLVFGQNNPEEKTNVEVMRVVKYDKRWNRLGGSSYYGINTLHPFAFGSLDMAEYGDFLYIRTCHEMFKSSDGKNHQANMSFCLRQSDLSQVSGVYTVSNSGAGYSSHSFMQYLTVAGDRIIGADHGDAYPRALVMDLMPTSATASGDVASGRNGRTTLQSLLGSVGANRTGASLGGLTSNDTYVLAASSMVTQNGSYLTNKIRNITVYSQPVADMGTQTNLVKTQLTNYAEGSGTSASTPFIIPIDHDAFAVLWELRSESAALGTFQVAIVNEKGALISGIATFNGALSDCEPVFRNGNITWYVTDAGTPTFYRLYVTFTGDTAVVTEDRSRDSEKVRAFVERMYTIILDRPAEEDGLNFWVNGLLSDTLLASDCAETFVMGPEFTARNLPNDAFLERLYKTFFGEDRTIEADPEGFAFWTQMLERGYSRKYVLAGFANSDEFTRICDAYGNTRGTLKLTEEEQKPDDRNLYVDEEAVSAYVAGLYEQILGREGDADGIAYWKQMITYHQVSAADAAMTGFFFSDEYLKKGKNDADFITDCYHALLGREVDAEGLAYWEGMLSSGQIDRAAVINGFGASPEFTAILQSYGLRVKE
ncbi:MAG: DUF4214 domain-containing protein [Lachnospiraceae bacterium]|nr:DUF4214 domain-containing protein [Lachnospiraceae bacterium]